MSSKSLASIGAVVLIIGLIGLVLVIFEVHLPIVPAIASAYGPCAAIVFGWLLIVPSAYRGISRKGYLALVVIYIVTFLGIAVLLSGASPWAIVVLYAGLGALATAARRSDRKFSAGDNETKACAADTLFGVTAILILTLAYYTVSGQKMTVGLVGRAFGEMFSVLAGLAKRWQFVQEIAELVVDNLEVEYYVYAVTSLFWLASDQTPTERKVPPLVAAYIVTAIGIVTLLGGLYSVFFDSKGDIPTLALQLCVCGLGVVIAHLGMRRVAHAT